MQKMQVIEEMEKLQTQGRSDQANDLFIDYMENHAEPNPELQYVFEVVKAWQSFRNEMKKYKPEDFE